MTGSQPTVASWPDVVVVMPIRNEAADLAAAVRTVLAQQYRGRLAVCLAVAPSEDGTEQIAADLARCDDRIGIVGNPARTTPAGLNAAIRSSQGDVIVRVDGHAELSPGYVERAVSTLARTGAANVGGIQRAVGTTAFEGAVATAMMSRFGTGGAAFHVGGSEGPTDTVYLGVFRRDAIESVGLFDERLVRNQDYELNIRLRGAGHVVWFDPQLVVTYRPRGRWRGLARQFFEYGRWKRVVARLHPEALRPRQMIPPAATLALVTTTVLGVRWRTALVVPLGYAAIVTMESARLARTLPQFGRLLVVYPTIHLAWGLGFIYGRPDRHQTAVCSAELGRGRHRVRRRR